MSDPTIDQEAASRLENLQAQLDKLGAAEDVELDDEVDITAEPRPDDKEASDTPAAGAEVKKEDAGEVDGAKQAEPKLVPVAALYEERRSKHFFKAQADELKGQISALQSQVEALKKGEPLDGDADVDMELLKSLEDEGPEFAKLATQVKSLMSKRQALEDSGTTAKPTIADRADAAADAEAALDTLPWLKAQIDKGGALAQEAFTIDKTLTGSYASLADRYKAVLTELAERNDLPLELVLKGADSPKAETTTEKVVKQVKELESEPNTLSDLAAASSGDDQVSRYSAMNPQARQAYLLKMSEGDRMAFVERLAQS